MNEETTVLQCDHQGVLLNTAVATNVFPRLQPPKCQARRSLCGGYSSCKPRGKVFGIGLSNEFMALNQKPQLQNEAEERWQASKKLRNRRRPTEKHPQKPRKCARHMVDGLTQDLRDSCSPGKMARTLFPEGVVSLKIHPSMNRDR